MKINYLLIALTITFFSCEYQNRDVISPRASVNNENADRLSFNFTGPMNYVSGKPASAEIYDNTPISIIEKPTSIRDSLFYHTDVLMDISFTLTTSDPNSVVVQEVISYDLISDEIKLFNTQDQLETFNIVFEKIVSKDQAYLYTPDDPNKPKVWKIKNKNKKWFFNTYDLAYAKYGALSTTSDNKIEDFLIAQSDEFINISIDKITTLGDDNKVVGKISGDFFIYNQITNNNEFDFNQSLKAFNLTNGTFKFHFRVLPTLGNPINFTGF